MIEKERVLDALFLRLGEKGFMPVEIRRIIKDVFNLREGGAYCTATRVNQGLERLGWRGHIVDGFTLELMTFLYENEGAHELDRHVL